MAQQTVGMIGLGIMGSAMSFNLGRAGFRVAGYDVASRRRAEHKRGGGIAAKSPGDVARRTDIIITSLPSARALAEVAAELAKSAKRSTVVVETSTLPIEVKTAARDALEGGRAVAGLLDLDLLVLEDGAQRVAERRLVVDHQDACAHRAAPAAAACASAAGGSIGR